MDYRYEALDEHSFQKLAQALVLTLHPRTQCLPVAQPDGGRDAVLYPDFGKPGFVVFQVKFTRQPGIKNSRDTVLGLISSDHAKVEELARRGATHYYLITNVSGTAHLDTGAIDKANDLLQKLFPIPAQVWWQDDLDRRLDNAPHIKWSYPQILDATDLLPLLLRLPGDTADPQASRTLTSYMATQYDTDREIKFKQVDLKRSLTDLFVDLPIAEKAGRDSDRPGHRVPHPALPADLDVYVSQLSTPHDYDTQEVHPFPHAALAAAFFLQMPLAQGVSRFVLEGAPGQGKSTVTQFVCQLNRLRLLRKEAELRPVDTKHKHGPIRTPFRVDLRDYAAWLNGRHPFSKTSPNPVPPDGRRSLESFLAMQISWNSGTVAINEDQLLYLLQRSHSVIVLDGFDEVADIPTRTTLVEEICRASARLGTHCQSLHVIVTSRPAAFGNSPGFPEADWVHLHLKNLGHANILTYKDKWIDAQRLDESEANMVSETLEHKLEQPHLRDLARNPMQLAILLHLIHVQGSALPEKRTTLYDEYMKLFFNREAEKSEVVRDRRELLLSIHGLLAWVLQTQVEKGAGSGSMTKDELHQQVVSYLKREEHPSHLADKLLAGTVERVGALVSRVQGTFEFEVQPLREYFAARHLYTTSPYSPAGRPCSGTRPDRFDALARNPYWTNVTRFFCGFCDVGELATLVDGLLHFGKQAGHHLTNGPRQLAMMLLGDHVFSQSPRAMKRLLNYIVEEPAFSRLTSRNLPGRRPRMGLPETAGRDILFEVCSERLEDGQHPERAAALREVMAANADPMVLKDLWSRRFREGKQTADPLREAVDFGILGRFEDREIGEHAGGDADLRLRWLAELGRYEQITEDPELSNLARQAFFDGRMAFPERPVYSDGRFTELEVLTHLLNVHILADVLSAEDEHVWRYTSARGRVLGEGLARTDDRARGRDPVVAYCRFLVEGANLPTQAWRTDLAPWRDLVDRGFRVAPRSHLISQIAALATAVSTEERGRWARAGFLMTEGLVDRMLFARYQGDAIDWWRDRLAEDGEDTLLLRLAIVLSWGEARLLRALSLPVAELVERLSEVNWTNLATLLGSMRIAAGSELSELDPSWFSELDRVTPRMAPLLLGRVADRGARRSLARRAFAGYRGPEAHVLQWAADYELVTNDADGVDWKFVEHLSRLARKGGLELLWWRSWQEVVKVPEDVATDVLANCADHCEQLVALCESSYRMRIAEGAEKVSVVAERDNWFALDPV